MKSFLTEEVILPELLSDNLSDGAVDIFNYSESDNDVSVRETNCAARKNYSDSETALRKVTVLQMRGQPRG
jgi:hypothetical protein